MMKQCTLIFQVQIIYLVFILINKTNPDITLNGQLSNVQTNTSSGSIGQVTLYIYLFSVFITVISSFGGNSMELMWIFTNNLQLIYYLSVLNVNFPDIVNVFFPYVQI